MLFFFPVWLQTAERNAYFSHRQSWYCFRSSYLQLLQQLENHSGKSLFSWEPTLCIYWQTITSIDRKYDSFLVDIYSGCAARLCLPLPFTLLCPPVMSAQGEREREFLPTALTIIRTPAMWLTFPRKTDNYKQNEKSAKHRWLRFQTLCVGVTDRISWWFAPPDTINVQKKNSARVSAAH